MIEELQAVFEANRDQEKAVAQKAYLKDQFEFLGIPKPVRAKLEKEFVKATKQLPKEEVISLVFDLTKLGYREYLYTGQMVLQANYKSFDYRDILELTQITRTNQWWENTDGFQSFLKKWFKANLESVRPFVLAYYKDSDMWMRRLAIIAQLGLKESTDFTVMTRAIRYNLKYDQFFIQKAIGWALRDYSKTNPTAVADFIYKYEDKLSNLAVREGSKYLGSKPD